MTVSIAESPVALYSLTFVLGACVGSFLNVLAIRLLAERNLLFPPSACMHCDHKLGPMELIPIASYFLLGGRCKHCREKISWQYPAVELFTALWFVLIVWHFGLTPVGFGMLYFSAVLIAVTVTDFREKLIPHEITYPSIIVGIIFSALVENDILGTMAGIGGSYILFDFIAFYGLKIYPLLHPELNEGEDETDEQVGETVKTVSADEVRDETPEKLEPSIKEIANFTNAEDEEDGLLDAALGVGPEPKKLEGEEALEEDFEVMGGGDAVLAALISAWLGWERLVITVMLGFVFGALLGSFYLVGEMKKAGIFGHCVRQGLLWLVVFTAMGAALFLSLANAAGQPFTDPQYPTAMAIFGFSGGFVGFIWTGRSVSRPFPFGPALTMAAAIAMFMRAQTINTGSPRLF